MMMLKIPHQLCHFGFDDCNLVSLGFDEEEGEKKGIRASANQW